MKPRILCIDDSKLVHSFLKECIKDNVSDFQSVFDGEAAVDLFNKNPAQPFDLIFLDWEMPKKIGPDVLKELKDLKVKIPVVMLTSKNDTADIARVLALGACEYILKPFTRDIILEKLAFIMGTEG